MSTEEQRRRFERLLMPHFDAAYNLARWLTRNDHDAEDVTHEAYVRAMTFFGSFRGDDGKAWLLAIVRNACIAHFARQKSRGEQSYDEAQHDVEGEAVAADAAQSNPEQLLVRKTTGELVNRALRRVPADVREVLILRELEDLSYKEIADVVGVPIGTVMSRLHRGRRLLREGVQRLDATLRPVATPRTRRAPAERHEAGSEGS